MALGNRSHITAHQRLRLGRVSLSWLLASCFLLSASCFSLGSLTCLLLSQVSKNAIRTQPRNGGRKFQAINNHFQRASAQSQARGVLPWLEPLHISRNALNYRPSSLHRRYFDQSRTSRTNFQLLSKSHCSLLKIIAAKLHGSAVEAFWAGTSFRLTATVFQPSYACFANVFGRKPMIMLAIIFFTTGSIVSAVANDFAMLLAGRTVQGMGAAGFTTMTEIIVTDLVPLRHRGLWFGIISMSVAVGSSVGPVIGGSLSENVSWVLCAVW